MKWEFDLKEYRARGVAMGRAIACVAVALATASLGCGESPPVSQGTTERVGGTGGVGGTGSPPALPLGGAGGGVGMAGSANSYFHAMKNAQGDLMDGIEAWEAQHLIIRHNWIEMPGGNSVIKLPLDVPVPGGDDVLIENNLIAGGGWAVYGGYDPPNSNPSYTNVRFIENRFSTAFEPKCGSYGAGAYIESALSHDNVWHETGEALEL